MKAGRFFLVESGELRTKAEDMRERRSKAISDCLAFAQARDGDAFRPDFSGKIGAIRPRDINAPPPEGWRIYQNRRKSSEVMWVPDRRAPKAVRERVAAEIAALPAMPKVGHFWFDDEVAGWLGWEADYRYTTAAGWGVSFRGYPQLAWTTGSFLIVLPSREYSGDAYAATFPVPDGCREISEAEWDLIVAQARVSADRTHIGRAAE